MKSFKELLEPKIKEFNYKLKEGEEIHKKDKYGAFIFCNDDYKCFYHGNVKISLKYVYNNGTVKYFCPLCEHEENNKQQENKENITREEVLEKSGLGSRYFYVTRKFLKSQNKNINKYLDDLNNGILEDLIILGSDKERDGKTLSCAVIINELSKSHLNISVRYISYFDLITELKSRNIDKINLLKDKDFLLIDDVAIDNVNKPVLKSLLDYRYSNRLQTVIVITDKSSIEFFKDKLENAEVVML